MTRPTSRPTTRRRLITASLALGVLPLLLSACDGQSLPTYRYRLSVEVDTPQGLKTGSSVIEVKNHYKGKGFPGPEAGGIAVSARGEAVAVDLPGGQTLFALLSGAGGDGEWAAWVMRFMVPKVPFEQVKDAKSIQLAQNEILLANILALQGAQVLPRTRPGGGGTTRANYPMLVRFKDLADPKSVEAVDPDALEKSFGPGTKLRRITVQVTDDAVTSGVGKRLVWLDRMDQHNYEKDGPFYKTYPTVLLGLRSNFR
jgi:hypothetical protein